MSNKVVSKEKITLIENNSIVEKDSETAKIFNHFFTNIVQSLEITQLNKNDPISENIGDPLIKSIVKFRNHPSIIAIKEKFDQSYLFNFSNISQGNILQQIANLDTNKAIQSTDIPTKIIKRNSDIFSDFIFSNINECIRNSTFPPALKIANITPVHKKDSKNVKENYRPVSILPNVSKIYEKIMFNQISDFFENIFSKFQCGFRKGFSVHHCLVAMLEKWKNAIDNKKYFGALVTDFSKAFDCLSHDLLIAKLNAYGFSIKSLRFIQSYLSNRKQRTKINIQYSAWEEIVYGIPQGSILGPLLFNIFMCDLFFIMNDTDFASYADDNTPYAIGNSTEEVIETLEKISRYLFKGFNDNQMKANPDKCHLICSSNDPVFINISDEQIYNSKCRKLLGVNFDQNLSFNQHMNEICKKA